MAVSVATMAPGRGVPRGRLLFGSTIRNDDSTPNDVDLLVVFERDQDVSLFDVMELEATLTELFGQPVDVVEPASLTNPIRRQNILASAERLYAA